MQFKRLGNVLFLCLFAISVASAATRASAQASTAIPISIPGAPLEITWYQAEFIPSNANQPLGLVEHRVQVLDSSDVEIVAFSIGFIEFDAFNQPMRLGMNGVRIQNVAIGDKITSNWQNTRLLAPFSFEKYGTGVAYIQKVRKSDGSVWTAPMDIVLTEVQKISSDFALDDFTTE